MRETETAKQKADHAERWNRCVHLDPPESAVSDDLTGRPEGAPIVARRLQSWPPSLLNCMVGCPHAHRLFDQSVSSSDLHNNFAATTTFQPPTGGDKRGRDQARPTKNVDRMVGCSVAVLDQTSVSAFRDSLHYLVGEWYK